MPPDVPQAADGKAVEITIAGCRCSAFYQGHFTLPDRRVSPTKIVDGGARFRFFHEDGPRPHTAMPESTEVVLDHSARKPLSRVPVKREVSMAEAELHAHTCLACHIQVRPPPVLILYTQ